MSRLKLLVVAAMAFGLAAIASASSMVIIGGRPMVPLRSLRDEFGASLSYDSRYGWSVSLDYHTARVRPGYRQAWIDNRPVYLDADAVIINGVLYVPMDFVSDAFGYDCQWDPGYQQVIIIQPRTHHRVSYSCDHRRDSRPVYIYRRDDRDYDRKYDSRPSYRRSYPDSRRSGDWGDNRRGDDHRYDRSNQCRTERRYSEKRQSDKHDWQRPSDNHGNGHAYGHYKDKGNGKGKGRGHRG